MNTVTIWTAQYLLWVMVAGFAAIWLLRETRAGKITFGLSAVAGLVLAVVFMYVAKSIHHDPRPFVQNPSIKPLFGHSTDDGFPSSHCVAAGLLAGLVFARHRLLGLIFAVCAVLIGWARVAAHVHHLQDVAAGLILGALAAAIGTLLGALVTRRLSSRAATRETNRPAHIAQH